MMNRARRYLPVRSSVFVARLSVVGAVEIGIPVVKTSDLVADKSAVGPAWTPKNGVSARSWHDLTAVVSHVRAPAGRVTGVRLPGRRIGSARPRTPNHGRFLRTIALSESGGYQTKHSQRVNTRFHQRTPSSNARMPT